jgi:membrane carboxypeptidase/penicillin-binding protein PbpC
LKIEPISILKVVDREGKVLEENQPRSGQRILSEGEAFLINHILSDNNARLITFGANSAINIANRQVAVKTGTTNDKRDNWTIGWTPQSIAGVWVGNNDNSPMKQVASGVSGAAPIWRRIILEALEDKSNIGFAVPEGVVTAEVDQVSGFRVHDGFPSRVEYFIKRTVPVEDDPVHTKLKLCRDQDKLATAVHVARGHYEEKEFFVFQEEDPVSRDEKNRWQEGINQWLETQTDPRYHPPADYCGSGGEIEINFVKPADKIRIDSSEVEVKAEAISTNEIVKIQLFIDGKLKESFKGKAFDKIYTLKDGAYHLKVEAEDEEGNRGSKDVRIGVNVPWDWSALPSPTPTVVASPTPTSAPSPTPTPPVSTTTPTP